MKKSAVESILKKPELSDEDIVLLLGLADPEDCEVLRRRAFGLTTEILGPYVYYRGLIELSNVCTANCRYCGIRKANRALHRYTMTRSEIAGQAVWAADHGYGSVCLQAGERHDEKFVEFICGCLREIHEKTIGPGRPRGVGVTLSLGDQTEDVYRRWAEACGNPESLRYLSRFETSNPSLFKTLHSAPGANEKNLKRRLECLAALRRTGYQVGTGVMIGIPGQTLGDLCRDIRLYQEIDADMIGMGPYLRCEGNDLEALGQMEPSALMQLSLNMIAVTRLVMGPVNIAAATALDALRPGGRELGITYGANVVMPNLSPQRFRKGYQLYDNKPCLEDEPTQCANCLEARMEPLGRRIGWNMMGSSRRYLRRVGRPDEEAPAESRDSGGRRVIRIRQAGA